MPKRFGHKVCSLATIIVAFSFVGCRTTASKLASVPGMSWLERDDEGWANFEPAPGLPRPSSTSEPTTEGTKSTANIASKSDSGSGTRSPSGASSLPERTSVASKPRFDAARYMPNNSSSKGGSNRSNAASTYGDYASAYGKYGAPKSLKNNDSNIAPQKGPYDVDVPKYASGGSGGSTSGYDLGGKYSNPSKPTSKAETSSPSYNFANRFDNSSPSVDTTPQATYTANANSRFGGATNSVSPSQTSTYTPPGFAKSAATTSNSSSRFGSVAKPAEATKSPSSIGSAGQNQLNTVAPANGNRGQIFNQFSGAARQKADGFVATSGENAQATAKTMAGQANQTFNRYSQPASQTFDNAANSAKKQFNTAAKDAINTTPANLGQFGKNSKFANSFSEGAQNAAQGTAQTFPQQTGNQPQSFADQATSAFNSSVSEQNSQAASTTGGYANKTLNNGGGHNISNTFANRGTNGASSKSAENELNSASATQNLPRQAVQNYASAAKDAGHSATQSVTPAQNAYPSTNTPNPFSVPVSPAPQNQRSTPTETFNSAPPGYSTPATPPGIQRSAAPFRPGSTSTYQGAVITRKPSTEFASNASNRVGADNEMVLAVGDKYQFPLTLR